VEGLANVIHCDILLNFANQKHPNTAILVVIVAMIYKLTWIEVTIQLRINSVQKIDVKFSTDAFGVIIGRLHNIGVLLQVE
jgi:hypothetical protein